MGRLLRAKPVDHADMLPFIPTGLPTDIFTGKYVRGYDGRWYRYGGLSSTNAVQAGPQRYKSTYLLGNCVNALARIPDADGYIMDSEYSHGDHERIFNLSNLYLDDPIARESHIGVLRDSLRIFNPTHEKARNLDAFIDYMTEIAEEKFTHQKDWMIETPFIDPKTGKRQRILLPTIAGIDSWSEAKPVAIEKRKADWDEDTETDKQRTIHMDEGWHKKNLMSRLPQLANKGGIYWFLSAHLAKKVQMGRTPERKDLQYMRADEVAVGVSRQFYYLMSTLMQIDNATTLKTKDGKECEYKIGESTAPTELAELDMVLLRCKNNNSGNKMKFVSSQSYGLLGGMTDYRQLTSNGYFGLGSPNKAVSVFQPDIPLPKSSVFKKLQDYKTARAMEILSELLFVQRYWSIKDSEINYMISPDELVANLRKTTYAIDDILNSRSWWCYDEKFCPRPYLALPDIIDIAMGNYKPDLFAVTNPPKKSK